MNKKTIKIIFVSFIAVAVVLAVVLTAVLAGGTGSHTTSQGIEYTVENGKLTITGYSGESTDVTIPSSIVGRKVSKIATNAFKGSKVKNVIFDGKFKSLVIEKESFSNSTSLIYVALPEGLTEIGESAFYGCTELTHIDFPSTLTTISKSAFYGCKSLNYSNNKENVLRLPEATTTIGEYAFYNCTALVTVYASTELESVSNYAFQGCTNLNNFTADTSANVANTLSVKTFGEYAFFNTKLTALPISSSTTNIGKYAFAKNSYNNSSASIATLKVPASVTTIGDYAFSEVQSLTTVTFDGTSVNLGVGVFSKSPKLANVTLPAEQTSIPSLAFYGCSAFVKFEIPANITNIGDGAFSNIGSNYSSSSTSHIQLTVAANSRSYKIVQLQDYYYFATNETEGTARKHSVLLSYDGSRLVSYIGQYNSSNCSPERNNKSKRLFNFLEAANIQESLNTIGSYAFAGSKITYLALPSQVTVVNSFFISESSISNVYFSSNTCALDELAFAGNTNEINVFTVRMNEGNITEQIDAIVEKNGVLNDDYTVKINPVEEWDRTIIG